MNRLWWQLPGPAQLVSTIAQDLQDGKNVLIALPKHMPRGFSSAIRTLSLDYTNDWYPIRPDKEKPADVLSSYFERDLSPNGRRIASALANSEKLEGKIIWLYGIEAAEWGAWEEFFADYGDACQHATLGRSVVFCIPLIASSVSKTSISEQFWSQYHWRGVVSSVDMILFTARLLQERTWSILQKRVATSVIAGLALWDPEVCHRLAAADFKDVLKPKTTLKEIAAERKWSRHSHPLPRWQAWQEGMEDIVDKKWMMHSALLALESSSQEIERRIWHAELPVLLPVVEEARQAILKQYGDTLRVPYRAPFQMVNDVYDLEINHIRSQIKRGLTKLSVESERLIHELTEIRNYLSHLKTVTFEMLDSDVLNRFVERQWEQEIEELTRVAETS